MLDDEVIPDGPFIGDLEDLPGQLYQEYEANPLFSEKIKWLSTKYSSLRRSKRDGNCFYRGFGFGYFEYLMNSSDEIVAENVALLQSFHQKLSQFYTSFIYEDFLDAVIDEVKTIKEKDEKYLLEYFRDFGSSQGVVLVLRLITAEHLMNNPRDYVGFMMEGKGEVIDWDQADDSVLREWMKGRCGTEVEGMGVEAEEVHVSCLSQALKCNVIVAQLHQSNPDPELPLLSFSFNPENPNKQFFALLYRPGHYDIIYPKK